VVFVHVSLVPYIGPSGELKTKPTQHSVRELRSLGIQPDAIVCRTDRPITDALKRKISLLSDVDVEAVVSAPDADSIYEIPLVLHAEGLDDYLVRHLRLEGAVAEPDLGEWRRLVERIRADLRRRDEGIRQVVAARELAAPGSGARSGCDVLAGRRSCPSLCRRELRAGLDGALLRPPTRS
jgi:CTP synthase (UTP-ammonia lyase)